LRDHGLEAQNVREGRAVSSIGSSFTLLKALSIGGCFIVLAGCAAAPRAPLPAHLLWQDQAFDYDAALVSVGKRETFSSLTPGFSRDCTIQGFKIQARSIV